MKINIGPYTTWIGPYQIADWLQHVGVSEDRCHEIGEWLSGGKDKDSWLMKLCNWIERKKKRRVDVRIDNYDTWSMDSTLAYIILPMLKQLRDTKHGSPCTMPAFAYDSNNAQLSFDFYAEGDATAWDVGHQQWVEILNEIIWTFEQIHPDFDWEEQYWEVHPEIDLSDHPEDEGKVSTPIRWSVEGKCDYDAMRKHGERIQAGLELFGKYYQNLWD